MGVVAERLRESAGALADVFRNEGLRRLNLALAGSVIGDWAYAVAVSVYAYGQGGAKAVGILGVVRFVSMAVLLPFTSGLADRFDRKRVMIASDLLRLGLVLVAAWVIAADGPAFAVYALTVVTSWVGTAFRPAQAALMPRLAKDPRELTVANVASSTIESVGFFLGPAIGGLLLAVADVAAVYVFDAATFGWSAFMVLGLRVRHSAHESLEEAAETAVEEQSEAGGFLAGAGAGFREVHRSRELRLMVGLYCAQTVVAGASLVFGVAIALELLDLGESGVGLLDATVGVGGLIGGFVALVLAHQGNLARNFGIGVVLWAVPLLLVAAIPELSPALVAMGLIGLANSVVDVNAFTIMQRLVRDEVMGRVFGAVESAIIAAMAVGSLLMPILMATIGLRGGLAVIGAAVSGLVLLGVPGLMRIDRVALAPAGLEVLRRVPLLTPLPAAVLERLARASQQVTLPTGARVFGEGDSGDRFYVIEEGTVEVTIRGEHVRDLGPGDSFGEIALLRDLPRTATIVATSDLVLRGLDRHDFVPAVTGHGEAQEEAELVVSRLLAIV
jgi:MFS family permease